MKMHLIPTLLFDKIDEIFWRRFYEQATLGCDLCYDNVRTMGIFQEQIALIVMKKENSS
ncbi:MAG: hypothetical protein O3B67_01585 [archaeon]|nr:hypothetical protein [archaeon]